MTGDDAARRPEPPVVREAPSPALPTGEPQELRGVFRLLAKHRDRTVPVVGAGVVAAAGAPTPSRLVEALQQAAGLTTDTSADLFLTADALEQQYGTAWVQPHVSQAVAAAAVTPTRTLRALVRLPSRIVATTNYDDAIEVAAEAVGLEPRQFHGETLNEGLRRPPDGVLHVLHLHGHHRTPSGLILSRGSYDHAANDPTVTFALRQLAAQYTLVFLGYSLSEREQHWRRDLLWAVATFRETGPHLLFLPLGGLPRRDLDPLSVDTDAVTVAGFRNQDGSFEVVSIAAQFIGLGEPATTDNLPLIGAGRRTPTYLPIPIAPADELTDRSQRQAWEFLGTAFGRHLDLEGLLGHQQVVLFGAPGAGKTQTLLEAGYAAQDRHTVYRSLGALSVPDLPAAAVDRFVSWVAEGEGFRPGTPRPTRDKLRDHVYLFLLDGLDEAPREDRPRILKVVEEVASRFPQHTIVVASRRYVGPTASVPEGFDAFELVPDRTWFHNYVDHVGVTPEQLTRTIPPGAPLDDLVRLPIFADAVVQAARRGVRLPASPLRAILMVASAGFDRESRLYADRERVEGWLDALAVIGEAVHTDEVPVSLALNPRVAAPFGLSPDEAFLDHLIQRTLLVSRRDSVGFGAHAIQEARAARALLASLGGLQLLKAYVLLELVDGTRGVHPSWRHTVELLAYEAPAEWREEIARFDPRLVARATPPDAESAARSAALHVLLDWYDDRRIWWLRESDFGQLRSDLDAIAVLCSDDEELRAEAVTWARARLDAADRVGRGNAFMLLSRLGESQLVDEAVPGLLQDPDPVVRRIAAESVEGLTLAGHHRALRAALDSYPEELEQRALLAAFLRTAPADDVVDLLTRRWPAEMSSWSPSHALDDRFTRHRQLELLVDHGVVEGWLDHLLSTDAPWSQAEAELLARLFATDSRAMRRQDRRIRRILHEHLQVTLPVVWQDNPNATKRLLLETSSPDLSALLQHDLPADLVEKIRQLLDRRSRPTGPLAAEDDATPPAPRRAPTLDEAVEEGWAAVMRIPDYTLDEFLKDQPDHPGLRQLTEDRWTARTDAEHGPADGLQRVDDTRIKAVDYTFTLLRLAAHYHLPLSKQTWLHLAEVGLLGDEYETWLRETFDSDWYPDVQRLIPQLTGWPLMVVARVLPADSIPPDLATALVLRVHEQSPDYAYGQLLASLADAGRHQTLKRVHDLNPTQQTLRALVCTGDCDAELQLLEDELAEPLPTTPSQVPDDHWLANIQCATSIPPLLERIRQAETADTDLGYLSRLHAALQRVVGVEGLRLYEELMADATIPEPAFLWFRWAELRDLLLSTAVIWEPSGEELHALLAALERRPDR